MTENQREGESAVKAVEALALPMETANPQAIEALKVTEEVKTYGGDDEEFNSKALMRTYSNY